VSINLKECWLPFPELYDMDSKAEKELEKLLRADCVYLSLEYRSPEKDDLNTYLEYWKKVLQLAPSDGILVELGVFQGTSANLISDALHSRGRFDTVYGFDCFSGLPEGWRGLAKGTFSVDSLPAVRSNVRLIDGLFSDTLPEFCKEKKGQKISFLHMDADLYSSTMTGFKELHHMFVPGTIIAFDEFALWPGFYGEKQSEFEALMDASELYGFKYEYVLRGWDHPNSRFIPSKQNAISDLSKIAVESGNEWKYSSTLEPKVSAREKAVIRITDVQQ